ncbi:HAMP domain-containing protein [Parabacteroides acidifaciens]|uniref:histidine kinase n=1 Tax=Parabacteroides acidifaciens TaxID=2290935 RepID=A0A3D8H8K6_9BACT|nr:ATP-binding protein [Parabacteroides acidifaciens]MBC8603948.1 HAMP domain-containing protein [Parabacteroides acidifaciens]RDU47309.1 HAMP domain-containing protein [Parabacteroides acidifaciens]
MKIRTALTLKNTGVTATVFLLCMAMIYLVSDHTRSKTFYHDLKSEAVTKAHLFLQNQVDARTMQSIYLNNKKFINEVEVAIYTTDFRMLYHDAIQNDIIKENREMIDRILREKEIEFYVDKYQSIGMLYSFDGKDYIVTAAAYDGYGYDNLFELRDTLLVLFVIGLSLLFVSGYILARASLKPIRDIVREAETITAHHIDRRLPVKNGKDELGELSTTFNALLERLEASFNSQKMFVSNVSHEMRTPLAALIAELDLALQKERTGEQYRKAMQNALQDAGRMNKLIDGLLNLAKADYQKEQIKMQEIRLDELLLDVREFILRAHPDYHIELLFEQEDADDDNLITVQGNLYLLNIAFSNLIENNCKYSADKSSFIQISFWDKWTIVRLSDDGIGMSETDKQNLFTLFYRGDQENKVTGHGIGMALAQKIIHLHQGNITVHSEYGKGTTFVIELPHI